MKISKVFCLLLVLGWSFLGTSVGAVDVGWMQKGVRVWYFGGVGTGMSSNAEEAYLLGTINGANVQVTHHSAVNYWGLPNPVDTPPNSTPDQGPCWIHPVVLQNLQIGDHWKGLEITKVTRSANTYNTFLNTALPAPNQFLPIKALFDLKSQRDLVNIVYKIDNYGSSGAAYFDAETGLALYYNASSASVTYFFILSEINYDFARRRVFAEDDGPHTGFQSYVYEYCTTFPLEQVYITSVVETRYGNTVALHVQTLLNGGAKNTDESYCFFGNEPMLRYIDWTLRTTKTPDQWTPFGDYLFWWLPPTALNNPPVNIYKATMQSAGQPLTFKSSDTPQNLYFTDLWFGNDGYMTQFYAKDPTVGLDLNNISYKDIKVNGLDYYRSTMGKARPVTPIFPAIAPMLLY